MFGKYLTFSAKAVRAVARLNEHLRRRGLYSQVCGQHRAVRNCMWG